MNDGSNYYPYMPPPAFAPSAPDFQEYIAYPSGANQPYYPPPQPQQPPQQIIYPNYNPYPVPAYPQYNNQQATMNALYNTQSAPTVLNANPHCAVCRGTGFNRNREMCNRCCVQNRDMPPHRNGGSAMRRFLWGSRRF
ncbi:unnamed protein product [Blepharisma stoltei]|uniref:Uncharacterized protein n=1 Tax=Blepharisma stoltei TaxID=1481888 RepID=A0AAU9IJL4_9CILI|nr:unnamed protein product [Blepharisma stoltei]